MIPKRSAAERNQQAVSGGLWHQEEIARRAVQWRQDPIGWGVCRFVFGAEHLQHARRIEPRALLDLIAKPDLALRWIGLDGETRTDYISAKLISSQAGATLSRPAHHAARVRFEVAREHFILPDDPLVAGWILEHFIDGEPLSLRVPEEQERVLQHFRDVWARIARCALAGAEAPHAQWLLISMAQPQGLPPIFLGDAAYVPVAERTRLAQEEAEQVAQQSQDIQNQNIHNLELSTALSRNTVEDCEPTQDLPTLDTDASVLDAMAVEVNDPSSRLTLLETRVLSIDRAVELISQMPPSFSKPRESQLGSIGSPLMLIQRGQAKSLGPQRDMQVKICAGALFAAATPLPQPVARSILASR